MREAERQMRGGVQAFQDSDYAAATNLFARAHGLYRSIDSGEGMALAGINLAETALAMGSYARADSQIHAARALVATHGLEDRFGARLAVLEATAAHGLGDRERALARLADVLPAFDEDQRPDKVRADGATVAAVVLRTRMAFEDGADAALWTRRLEHTLRRLSGDDVMGRARLLRFQGQLAQRAGDPDTARERLTHALALYRQRAHRAGTAATLYELGGLAADRGDWHAARDYFERALYIHTWILGRPGTADALASLARVHEASGDLARAEAAQRWSALLRQDNDVNWSALRDQVIPALP
ncbi:MAG: tetratricopeptide repeat protein [Thiohalomonadaceae bacterium]